ncbi:hypothetical protein GMMP15_720038 [Candidatus Magnetomoraceae bacterium gMMP-15]
MKTISFKSFVKAAVISIFVFFALLMNTDALELDSEKFVTTEIKGAKIISPKSIESASELREIFKDIAAQHTKRSAGEVEFDTLDFHGMKVTYPKGIKDSSEILSELENLADAIVTQSLQTQMTPSFKSMDEPDLGDNSDSDKENFRAVDSIINRDSQFNDVEELIQQSLEKTEEDNNKRATNIIDYSDWKSRTGQDFATIDFLDDDCNTHATKALGINDRGHIVGTYEDNGRTRGFLYAEDEYSSLDFSQFMSAPVETYPRGINKKGYVVGNYKDISGEYHAFVYKYDTEHPHKLGKWEKILTGLKEKNVYDINDEGSVIGYTTMPQVIIWGFFPMYIDLPTAFKYSHYGNGKGGIFWYLDDTTSWAMNYFATYAFGLNNNGDIVGNNRYTFNPLPLGFVRYGSGGYASVNMHYAWDINDDGVIVGYGTTSDGEHVGVIQDNNGLKSCNFKNAKETYPMGISNSKTVVGYYTDETGTHGFVTPGYEIGFRARCNGWKFNNSRKNVWPYCKSVFWYPDFLDCSKIPDDEICYADKYYNWPILYYALGEKTRCFPNWSLFLDVFVAYLPYNEKHWPAAKKYWLKAKGVWGGSCYGFATSSLLAFNDPSAFYKKYCYEPLVCGIPSHFKFNQLYDVNHNELSVKLINKFQIYQNGYLDSLHRSNSSGKNVKTTLSEIKEMLSSRPSSGNLRNDRVLCIAMRSKCGGSSQPPCGGHAVVPYKVEQDYKNPTKEYIYVYDNNQPYKPENPQKSLRKITIDKSDPNHYTWSYMLFPESKTMWNGDKNFYLSRSMNEHKPEQLLFKWFKNVKRNNLDEYNNEVNYITLYNTPYSSIIIQNQDNEKIGFDNDELINTFKEGIPLIGMSLTSYPPKGYFIPNEPYTIQMQDFAYTSTYLSVFSDSIIYNYKRSDTDSSQTDYFSYGDGFEISNEDSQSKNFNIETIIPADDNEKVVSLSTSLSKNESIHFDVVNDNNLQIVNNGAAKNYNLWIRYVSQAEDCEINFTHDNVSLPANSSCQIVPFWDDLRVQGVQVLIDYNSDGTTDESLNLSNEASPHLVAGPSQLELSNENGTVSFDVCNIGGGAMEWIAQTNDSWLTIQEGNSGINHGIVTVSYPENTQGARSGYIQVTAIGAINTPATIEFRQKGIISEPTAISASDGAHSDKIQIAWEAIDGAGSYKVYRSTDRSSYGEAITDWITDTNYDDFTAEPQQTYYYWIKSADSDSGNNESWYSPADDGWRSCPSANFKAHLNTCLGDTVNFTNLSENTDSTTTYEWDIDNDGTVDYTTSDDISHYYDTPGTYIAKLTIANNAGCSDSITRTVNIISPPEIDLKDEINICKGEKIEIDDDFFSYNWSNGLSKTNSLTVGTSGTYSVTVMDGNFCSNSHTFNVNLHELPVVSLGDDISFCEGESVTLDAGAGFSSYTWNSGLSNEQTLTVEEAGIYRVEVSNANGCINSDEIELTYRTLDKAIITPETLTSACEGDAVTLNANTGIGLIYQWQKDGNDIEGANGSSYAAKENGVYTVEVTNCGIKKLSEGVQISVYPASSCPLADFASDYTTVSAGKSIKFTDKSIGHPTSWEWTFNGGSPETSTDQNPTIQYNSSGIYDVTLTVVSDSNSDTITKTAYIHVINDASVKYVYTLGKIPIDSGFPHQVYATVKNGIDSALTDYPVTLNITGANIFKDVQTISNLTTGQETVVYFNSYTSTNLGTNRVTVSIPADDDSTNNSKSYTQVVTENLYSYADDSEAIVGYGQSLYILMNKYHINGSKAVTAVNVHISNDRQSIGQTAYAVVLDGNANILARSDDFIIGESDLKKMHTFRIEKNPVISNSYFYVGIAAPSGPCFPVAAQREPSGRKQAYYMSYLKGKTIQEQTNVNRWVIEAVIVDPAPVLFVTPDSVEVGPESGRVSLNIVNKGISDMSWRVIENSDWFSIDKTSGRNFESIIVNYEANTGEARSDTLTITAEDAEDSPQVIEVRQSEVKAYLRIPLHKEWNLISFSINKCFYIGTKPAVPMIEGIEYEQINSISDILTSIDGQYSYVMGFDETGATVYNLSPWSNMKYMAAGYGYWIKINDDTAVDENGLIYLELEGTRISGDTAIPLHEGWNLVGYLGNKVQYVGNEPDIDFPDNAVMYPINVLSDAFSSIDDNYSYVMGFDADGAKVYNLSPWSNMKYVGPGCGYWIKVNEEESPALVWEPNNN